MAKREATLERRRIELNTRLPHFGGDFGRLDRALVSYAETRPDKMAVVQAFRLYYGLSDDGPIQTYEIAQCLGRSQSWVRASVRKLEHEIADSPYWKAPRPKVRRTAAKNMKLDHYEIAALLTMWRMRSIGTKAYMQELQQAAEELGISDLAMKTFCFAILDRLGKDT